MTTRQAVPTGSRHACHEKENDEYLIHCSESHRHHGHDGQVIPLSGAKLGPLCERGGTHQLSGTTIPSQSGLDESQGTGHAGGESGGEGEG
jgi:hypothetical protein